MSGKQYKRQQALLQHDYAQCYFYVNDVFQQQNDCVRHSKSNSNSNSNSKGNSNSNSNSNSNIGSNDNENDNDNE